MNEYLSLFDYLKAPAGKELGGLVLKFAKSRGVKPKWRPISNPTYTGVVATYPKQFLVDYFRLYNIYQDTKQYFIL